MLRIARFYAKHSYEYFLRNDQIDFSLRLVERCPNENDVELLKNDEVLHIRKLEAA